LNNLVAKLNQQTIQERSCDVCGFATPKHSTGDTIMPTLREKMKQEMILRGFSLGTQENYLRAVIKLHAYFNRNPAKLSTEEIKSFLLTLASQPIAASTYNINIHGLKFFYEVVLGKPMVAIKLPRKREPQKLPDILSASEVERIIKVTTHIMYRTLFILIYGAGLRASEAASLRTKDIDRSRSVIHIRCGKGNKDRYVILSPAMLNALSIYWKQYRSKQQARNQEDNDFLFLSATKKVLSYSSIGTVYRRSKLKAGIKKQGGVHALRHAFATHALESGADLFTIKQLLGHASVTSTVRYLRMTDKTLQLIQSPIEKLCL
jgi:integrase/recombinase XerD